MTAITRRALMASLTVSALGLPPLPPASAEAAPVILPPSPEFGYSVDGGEEWQTGFASRDAAISEAFDYGYDAFHTAEITPEPVRFMSKPAEDVVVALSKGDGEIGEVLVCALQGVNEEVDYEGEFGLACADSPIGALSGRAIAALATAFQRAGRPDLAARITAGIGLPETIHDDDPVLDAVSADATLNAELRALLVQWVEDHGLAPSLRALIIDQEQSHHLPADAAEVPGILLSAMSDGPQRPGQSP